MLDLSTVENKCYSSPADVDDYTIMPITKRAVWPPFPLPPFSCPHLIVRIRRPSISIPTGHSHVLLVPNLFEFLGLRCLIRRTISLILGRVLVGFPESD